MRIDHPPVRWWPLCLLVAATAHGQGPGAASTTVDIIDFGVDRWRPPDGVCADARFGTPEGSGNALRGTGGRVHGVRNDATDCRPLFESGALVLRPSIAPDLTSGLPASGRATIFVDPSQQTDVGIVSFDGESLGGRSGVPVVYAAPGDHLVGVQSKEDYACTVRVDGVDGATNPERPEYVAQPARRNAQASLVSIPALAGGYYRIQADIVDGLLSLRVTDAAVDRVVVDQRGLVAPACN